MWGVVLLAYMVGGILGFLLAGFLRTVGSSGDE